jgi:hypothetical protein
MLAASALFSVVHSALGPSDIVLAAQFSMKGAPLFWLWRCIFDICRCVCVVVIVIRIGPEIEPARLSVHTGPAI